MLPLAVSGPPRRDTDSPSTLTRLVEAEARWRDALAQADRECAALVAAAHGAAERAAQELESELATLVDARRRELASDIDRRLAQERADAHARAEKLRAIDGDALRQLVDLVLGRVFWSEDET